MAFFALSGSTLFLTGCAHYGNWWSLFAVPAFVMGILSPAVCFGYNREDPGVLNWDMDMDMSTFKSCRDMGWIVAMIIAVFSIGVPAIVWYNEPLAMPWPGVLWIMAGITQWWWAYAVTLRVFVFQG
jgi:hypothetical protein